MVRVGESRKILAGGYVSPRVCPSACLYREPDSLEGKDLTYTNNVDAHSLNLLQITNIPNVINSDPSPTTFAVD